MVLHIVNLWTGAVRDVANLVPQDYAGRQEQMLERFVKDENVSEEIVADWVSLEYIWDIGNLIAWSPDSRYLAFSAMIDGISSDVYLYDVDTGKIQRKETEYLDVDYIAWSPDSQWILSEHPSICFRAFR